MANPTYLKLNPKSAFFYDAASGLEVVPGQTVKIDMDKVALIASRTKIEDAIKGGHLQYSNEKEYLAWKALRGEKVEEVVEETEEDEEVEDDEETLEEKETKVSLIEQVKASGSKFSAKKLKKMDIAELKAHLRELTK